MSDRGPAAIGAAARQLNLGAALLALAVLADSGIEHYRGSFRNKAMYVPLVSASLALGGSLFGTLDRRAELRPVRQGWCRSALPWSMDLTQVARTERQ